jgi:hypothetical protein
MRIICTKNIFYISLPSNRFSIYCAHFRELFSVYAILRSIFEHWEIQNSGRLYLNNKLKKLSDGSFFIKSLFVAIVKDIESLLELL